MKNAVYLQSGGPTAVINSSFLGVIEQYQKEDQIDVLYGSKFGLQGLIEDNLIKIEKDKDYQALKKIPGAILGSARLRLKGDDDPHYQKILETCKKHSIHYIYVNGGNDSMDTGEKLTRFFERVGYDCVVVGICKTIDNDLENNDFSPGFASAVSYIVKSVMEISLDIMSYKKGRVTIIETMGRDAGWLCASTSIAKKFGLGPDLIYVPEVSFEKDKFLNDVKEIYEKQGRVLVCVSEALKDKDGNYIFADEKSLDSFGHIQLGSISKDLCDLVSNNLHYPTRPIEFNLMQRCAAHLQNPKDVEWAYMCGVNAIKYSLNKEGGVVSIKNDDGVINYHLAPFKNVANNVRLLPREYMNEQGNWVSAIGEKYFEIFIDESLAIEIPEDFR